MTIAIGVLVFASSFLLLYIVGARVLQPRVDMAERLAYYARRKAAPAPPRERGRIGRALAGLWRRLDVRLSVDQLLDEAGILLTQGEFWAISLISGAVCGGIGLLLTRGLAPVALMAGLVGLYLPLVWARMKRRQRRRLFEQQLPDALTAISTALRAGFGLVQAMSIVSRDQAPPISQEFTRAQREMQLGTTLDDALQGIVRRTESGDFDLAVNGMLISRQLGGNLSELLDNVVQTLRNRVRLKDMIRALTAQQRLSAWIVLLIPPLIMVALIFGMHDYSEVLWSTIVGRLLLGVALLMQIVGMLVVRRIISIEV